MLVDMFFFGIKFIGKILRLDIGNKKKNRYKYVKLFCLVYVWGVLYFFYFNFLLILFLSLVKWLLVDFVILLKW